MTVLLTVKKLLFAPGRPDWVKRAAREVVKQSETTNQWWMRYVIVPLIGAAGLIVVIMVLFISPPISKTESDSQQQYDLAEQYYKGRSVERDDVQAVQWYRRAAKPAAQVTGWPTYV